jgi:GMP synthase (glutamine-hydrolysing)
MTSSKRPTDENADRDANERLPPGELPRARKPTTRIVVLRTGVPVEPVAIRQGSFVAMFARGLRNAAPAVGDEDAAPALDEDARDAAALDVIEHDITGHGDDDALPDTTDWHAAIMTGSPAYVGDAAPWMRWAARLLRHLVATDVPYLGVCFGHQMLGVAMGADVGENPHGREMGTADVTVTADVAADPLLCRLPPSFRAQVSHRDVIRVPGPRLQVLARAPHDPHHIVRAGRRQWGVQFHPEFNEETSRLYLEARSTSFDEARGAGAADARRAAVTPSPAAARLLPQFARIAAEEAARRVHPHR